MSVPRSHQTTLGHSSVTSTRVHIITSLQTTLHKSRDNDQRCHRSGAVLAERHVSMTIVLKRRAGKHCEAVAVVDPELVTLLDSICYRSRPVVLNSWVGTQKWVADLFSVGRGPLSGEGNAKKKTQKTVIHTTCQSVIHTP